MKTPFHLDARRHLVLLQTCAFYTSLPVSVHPEITGGLRDDACGSASAILNPTWLVGFQQANLIFINTGLCFSFITAGSGGELWGFFYYCWIWRRVVGLGG